MRSTKLSNASKAIGARQSLASAIDFETLEARQLMTVLSVADFGASGTGSGDNRAAFQAALNAAKPGDTVTVPAGTYNISNTINIPTGVTLNGLSNATSHIKFNLPFQTYGISVNANDSNVTIENLDIVSSSGVITMGTGSQYTNVHILNNRFQFGGTYANGKYVFGIWSGVLNEGLEVNNNYFHDSLKSVRDWEIYYAKDATLDHNTMYNTFDGGHLMEPQDNVSFSYNYGTRLGRMGQEIQGDTASHNLKVVGNSFSDWVNPYYDSFGLSVVNHNAINTLVAGNYLSGTFASGASWGAADNGGVHRFGYGIEIGAVSATVKDNTLVGNWVAGIVSSRNAVVQDNQIWGTYKWGDLTTEGGLDGSGKETLIDNTIHASVSGAPTISANTNDYTTVATSGDSVTVTPPPIVGPPAPTNTSSGISNLTVTVLSDNSVKLTWLNNAGLTHAQISIVSTVGHQSFGAIALSDNSTSATIIGLHAGWQLDFAVSGNNSAGTPITSAAVTAQMTGDGNTVAGNAPTLASPISTPVTTPATAPASTAAILNATAKVLANTRVQLSWTVANAIQRSLEIGVVTTVGRTVFPGITYDSDRSTATISGLHAGWQYDFIIKSTTSDGQVLTSDPITVQV